MCCASVQPMMCCVVLMYTGSTLHGQVTAFMQRPFDLLKKPLTRMEVTLMTQGVWHCSAFMKACFAAVSDSSVHALIRGVACAAVGPQQPPVPAAGKHTPLHHGWLVRGAPPARAASRNSGPHDRQPPQLGTAARAVRRLRSMAASAHHQGPAPGPPGLVAGKPSRCPATAGAALGPSAP